MVVLGAPAIGVRRRWVGAGCKSIVEPQSADLEYDFRFMCKVMGATRPTAVKSVLGNRAHAHSPGESQKETHDVEELKKRLVLEAQSDPQRDIESNRALGKIWRRVDCGRLDRATHCNAGALATARDYGTALGMIRRRMMPAKTRGVIADETRPFCKARA